MTENSKFGKRYKVTDCRNSVNPKQDKLKEFHTRHVIIKLLKIIKTFKRYLKRNDNTCKNTCDSAKAYFRGKFIAVVDFKPCLILWRTLIFFFLFNQAINCSMCSVQDFYLYQRERWAKVCLLHLDQNQNLDFITSKLKFYSVKGTTQTKLIQR